MANLKRMLAQWRDALAGRFINQQGRMPALDALRGIAALVVVAYHYTIGYPATVKPFDDRLWLSVPLPSIGVQVFFAISGFVIFMTLERSKSGRDFFVSRFARLYPPFIFCMLLTASVCFATGFNPRNVVPGDVLMNLPMVVGLLDRSYIDPSYWTLTSEICFYALISVFFYQVQRRLVPDGFSNFGNLSRNPLVLLVLLWMIVAVYGRGTTDDLFSRWSLAFNYLYGHLFVAGIAVYGFTKGKLLVPSVLLSIAVVAGGVTVSGQFSAGGSIKVLVIAALILICAQVQLGRRMAALAAFLGGISYSLYLIHQTLGYMLINKLEAAAINSNLAVLGAFAVVIGLAFLIRKYIEIPSQNLIVKLYAPWKAHKVAVSVPA